MTDLLLGVSYAVLTAISTFASVAGVWVVCTGAAVAGIILLAAEVLRGIRG